MTTAILLVDNGSLRPAATLALRAMAAQVAAIVGQPVRPVSLLHSSAIAPSELEGQPAEILEPTVRRLFSEGYDDFRVLPYFIGPSKALTEYLPERVAAWQKACPGLRLELSAPLFAPGEATLADALADLVLATLPEVPGGRPAVAVVDHGSPAPEVTAVRNALAEAVAQRLGDRVRAVAPCSMERRPGPDYAFNEPLLADLLATAGFAAGPVILSMLFLSPGRHAGPDGDVATIAAEVARAHPTLVPMMTPLLGTHPALPWLLARRLQEPPMARW